MTQLDHLDRASSINRLRTFGTHWAGEVATWRASGEAGTEKKYAQSFWSDLLHCFGINAARQHLFEREAQRASTGRHGWIDFFMPSIAIGEAKSVDIDLERAGTQVDDYLAGGSIPQASFPRYSLLSNFATLHITRLDGQTPPVSFGIADIAEHYDDLKFLIGHDTLSRAEQETASIHAAELMAKLYTAFLGEDTDTPIGDDRPLAQAEESIREAHTSILMTRLLFLLYGDDAGLWERDLFYRWVDEMTIASSIGAQLGQLFAVLNTPVEQRSANMDDLTARFPYVNGGLFEDSLPPEWFTPATRDALLDACRFQWTSISVSVFGAMFQLVKSKEARRHAGEHYTSETNILKTIGPLFLDEFRAEADRLIRNKTTSLKAFDDFLNQLASHIFVDPACGSGNFLNLAYAKLREIETDIIVEKRRRVKTGGQDMTLFIETEQRLRIGQFYGFEIGWWPAKIAETSMFLVDHQANQRLAKAIGLAPDRLPITMSAHITHGNALRLDWEKELPTPAGRTYIFGNPPFLGHISRSKEQVADMREIWGTKDISRLDYATCWHAKSLALLAERQGSFAFVTTNSITQGDQVPRLFGPIFAAGWRIRFAHRTFAWNSDAPGKAAVHCVIVGFDRDDSPRAQLWDYPDAKGESVKLEVHGAINAYLIDGPNALVEKSTKPLSPVIKPAVFGNMARDGGNLIVEPDQYDDVIADPVAAKYVRPFRGSRELLHNKQRWCLWLVDMNPSDVTKSPVLKSRLTAVAEFRRASSAASTRKMAETPHLFGQRSQPDTDYLCLPKVVSETRRYFTVQRYPATVIASDLVFHAQDPDGLQFALASSSMFITWQRAVGGRLESRLRFANTLTWNTFPVPALDEKTRAAIIKGGQAVLDARALHPERSLADHYNPLAMDPALVKAHDKLDRAVDKAFGARALLRSEKERLELLFSRYAELTA